MDFVDRLIDLALEDKIITKSGSHHSYGDLDQPQHCPIVSNDTVLKRTNSNTHAGIRIGILYFQISSNDLQVGFCPLD